VARGVGERSSSPSGSGQSPAAKQFLVHFMAENASGDYHSLMEILPSEDLDKIWCPYTRMMGLSCGKEIVMMSVVV